MLIIWNVFNYQLDSSKDWIQVQQFVMLIFHWNPENKINRKFHSKYHWNFYDFSSNEDQWSKIASIWIIKKYVENLNYFI